MGDQSRAPWQYAVAAMPPVAAVAATLALVDYVSPEIAHVRALLYLAIALMAASGSSLVLLSWKVKTTSRRLKRQDVWIAAVLTILVPAMLSFVLVRAQHIARESDVSDVSQPGSSDP